MTTGPRNVPERRRGIDLRRQAATALPLVVVWLLGTMILLAVLSGDVIPDERFLLDPALIAGMPWHTGLISNLGVLAWATSAVSAGLGAFIARLDSRSAAFNFLMHSALLSTLLALEDMLRLHSGLFPKLLGIPETAVLFSYMVLISIWFVVHQREIRRTRFLLLYGAVVAFIISVVVDVLNVGGANAVLVEDAPKFLGVLAWATYFVLTSTDIARSVVTSNRTMP
ncbi:MAG: hypothetical protein ACI8XZ_002863 [Gammaproteobacteria bacterium]|jgi:hypothetical protein